MHSQSVFTTFILNSIGNSLCHPLHHPRVFNLIVGMFQTNNLFIYLFIYNNFICNNQYKKAAIREELNPHVRWPPKNIYKAIKEI